MPRPREFDKDDVLDKAMMLFWARGFETASVRDLTGVMGISSSSLYETFGDKHAVYMAALERYCQQEQARMAHIAETAADPAEFIRSLFASLNTVVADVSTQGSLAFNAMVEFGTRDTDVSKQLLHHYTQITAIVTRTIERWQLTGSVNEKVPAEALAHLILSTLIGVITVASVDTRYARRDDLAQLILRLLQPTF